MPNTDIMMRLQLNAEQFSSEVGKSFANFKANARSATDDFKSSFASSYAEVQRLASTLPKLDIGGTLDLSGEIAGLRAAAAAADQRSESARRLSIAMLNAADAVGVDREALLRDSDAAAVSALADEKKAETLRQRIVAMEATNESLREMMEISDRTVVSTTKVTSATGASRAAMANLSFQVQDTITQLSMGANAFQVLAIQGGQAAGAFAFTEGAAGSFARFMIGPWGLAITAGAMVLGPFVSKLFESADASKAAQDASAKLSSYVDDLGNFFDRTTGKIKETNHQLMIYAALSAADKRDAAYANVQAAAAKGNQALQDSTRRQLEGSGVYTPGSGYGGSFTEPSDELTKIFRPGRPLNDPNIDKELLRIATDNRDKNAEYARTILDARGEVAFNNRERYRQDKIYNSLLDGKLDPSLIEPAKPKKERKGPKPKEDTTTPREAEDLARLNEQWDAQPKLVDKAADANRQLDKIMADLEARKPPGFEKMIEQIGVIRENIRNGMNKPFDDFVKQQKESLALQQLTLQGLDVEAAAMQDILRIQDKQGQVSDEQIAQAYKYEAAQKAIAEALQDQQRILNISSGYVGNMQRDFDQFLKDLDDGNHRAVGGLFKGWVEDFKQLRRDLISNAVFGGVDRDIQQYIRQVTGKQTPAEVLLQQANDAGAVMKSAYDDAGGAVTDFATTVRNALENLTGSNGSPFALRDAYNTATRMPNKAEIADLMAELNISGAPANDNVSASDDIVVTAIRSSASKQLTAADKMLDAGDIFHRASGDILGNLEKLTGIAIPKAIKDAFGGAIEGASIFSSIGAQFGGQGANIGAGIGASLGALLKPDSPLMKNLGPYAAVYELGQAIQQPIAKSLDFNSTAVAVGGLPLGGLLKLFGIGNPIKWGDAGLSINQFGAITGSKGIGSAGAGAGSASGSVADQLNSILDQLGATLTSLAPVTVGSWNGKYRVALTNTNAKLNYNNFNDSVLKNFDGDQNAAIAYAVEYELSHSVISGISAASQKILGSGQDISKAIEKVLSIESIPHDLKAMLDPVGSAIDDLNKKWADTVAALNEGGATAEQMAQAQQLYNLQLDQVKANTQSASQGLKDFLNSLKVGSDSPYSLRDQESSAMAALKPFLDQIAAGQSIDQGKYQDAASQYLDVERQLYGSTQAYFDAMDTIQAATNKAIAAIDNAVPVTPGVPDPFTKATADSTATVATNTQTQNELTDDTNDLLRQAVGLLTQMASNGNDSSAFVNDARNFLLKTG